MTRTSMRMLASASPRRQELLRNAGMPLSAHPANVPEEYRVGETPETSVRRLAREKAEVVSRRFDSHAVILAADREVILDLTSGAPLGKPRDEHDAVQMLRSLRGRGHYVITGISLTWKKKN